MLYIKTFSFHTFINSIDYYDNYYSSYRIYLKIYLNLFERYYQTFCNLNVIMFSSNNEAGLASPARSGFLKRKTFLSHV